MSSAPIQMSVPIIEHPQQWGWSLPAWTRITLIWLMAITVTGAAVRLTGSGLGCTDWPNCTVNTELDAPGFHSAVEFGNRMISGLAIIPVIAAWMASRKADRSELRPWFVAMVLGFLGQVLLGMLVTRTELDPRVVLGHFLLSIVLIFIGVVLDYRARVESTHKFEDSVAPSATQTSNLGDDRARRRLALGLLASATLVIIVGTLVTGSGPHTGSGTTGEPVPRLGFDIREISRVHSLFGWLVVSIIVFGLYKNRPSTRLAWGEVDRTWFTRIGMLAVVQGAIGYLQYATGVPVGLVAVHIAGSVVLWTTICWYALLTSYPQVTKIERDRALL